MTHDQLGTCIRLHAEGFLSVNLPWSESTPIPGLILLIDHAHRKLLMVQPDGSTSDLLEVHRLAKDLVRNWHKGMPPSIPGFVGDFGRLNLLAVALNDTPAPKEDGT